MTTAFLRQSLTIKEIWLASLKLYRKIIGHVWLLAAILGILLNISLLGVFYMFTPHTLVATIVCIIACLISQLLDIYLVAVILHRIYVLGANQNSGLRKSFVFVNKKYSTIIICELIGYFFILLGVFFFMLPGVYMKLVFLLLQPLILFANKSVFTALRESFQLMRSNWWRTFITFLPLVCIVLGLTVFVVNFLIRYGVWYWMLGSSVLMITFFYPLWYSLILLQFANLQARRVTV